MGIARGARVSVLAGPAHSGKTTRLLARYRKTLATELGAALWLAPTQRAAAFIRQRLLDDDLRGCLAPGVMTFDQFAAEVLRAGRDPTQPISSIQKRRLVAWLIQNENRAGRLRYFAPIADTPGLVDLVCEWIGELKRLEVWPEEFRDACLRREERLREKDRELLALYDAYQRQLNTAQLYDAEGRFWAARAKLREGQRRPFERLQLVVADGFEDFTRTQHEMLEVLAERVGEVWISLPLEGTVVRRDLFAKSLHTLERLRRYHKDLELVETPRQTRALWPALSHVETELFKNPREQRPAPSTEGIEVLAAARELGEIEEIGRRIKTMLVYGDYGDRVTPADVAVVFRSLTTAAPLVREVFGRLGIPFAIEAGQRLDRSPMLTALVNLLRLDTEDWPLRRLLSVIGSNFFRPAWAAWKTAEAQLAIERELHHIRVPSGREAILGQLEKRAERARNEAAEHAAAAGAQPDQAVRDAQSLRQSQGAWDLARSLAAAIAQLPERASYRNWSLALERLAREIGLLPEPSQPDYRAEDAQSDLAAWQRLQESLESLDDLSVRMSEPLPPCSRRELLAVVEDILRSVELPPEHEETGRVRVLSAVSVRGLQIPYLFCAGLTEKAFPPAERNDRLYHDAEIRELVEQGLPLVHSQMRSQEEMLLFYELINRATRRLYLSFPALDEKAQSLLPSPFVTEVEQTLRQPDTPGGGVKERQHAALSPLPPADVEPVSLAEWRVAAIDRAIRTGDVGLLAGLQQFGQPEAPNSRSVVPAPQFAKSKARRAAPAPSARSLFGDVEAEMKAPAPTVESRPLAPAAEVRAESRAAEAPPPSAGWENLLAALELTKSRSSRQGFGAYEGMLASPAARALLTREFATRAWSPVQLERYQECPFKFLLSVVLGVQPLDEAALETDFASRGVRLHETLVHLHRQIQAEMGAQRPEEAAEFQRYFAQALEAVLSAEPADNPLDAALLEIDRRVLAAWGEEYFKQHQKYDDRFQALDVPPAPTHFEVEFGPQARRGGADSVSRREPLELKRGRERVLISGRIDRIDLGQSAGRAVFNIVDYKSGSSAGLSKPALAEGRALQLPLYAMAVEQLLLADQGAVPLEVGYWFVKEAGYRWAAKAHESDSGALVRNSEWEATRSVVVDKVFSLVAGIRDGQFPVYNPREDCTSRCEFRTVCRIAQIRSLEKTWTPPVTSAATSAAPSGATQSNAAGRGVSAEPPPF